MDTMSLPLRKPVIPLRREKLQKAAFPEEKDLGQLKPTEPKRWQRDIAVRERRTSHEFWETRGMTLVVKGFRLLRRSRATASSSSVLISRFIFATETDSPFSGLYYISDKNDEEFTSTLLVPPCLPRADLRSRNVGKEISHRESCGRRVIYFQGDDSGDQLSLYCTEIATLPSQPFVYR